MVIRITYVRNSIDGRNHIFERDGTSLLLKVDRPDLDVITIPYQE